ncbi:MAG: hypothetical protein US68_C0009G0007 [Candidatus Shapirobacteria bacterium GW2011_GWE1_38_10]|uniref:DUF2304 domain-containing protein n=1 Tax=Candidatus Shapirobacteria bacterium GW2011_GWE1_38_10 TaxID=1618488 RepID=A0A0G0I669_9BACT|nr:MAG: hypothetical protein US46_C0002G0024 [Candidatus Shapirobacteria bacterium GW2011_GWF2_37_20]KKQ50052.1 MAG: hypothetical protein US68_C0009G0007 [Candidatus Shapirobacteria bacterium GW2011_GWE1_38_10]KKQ64556.1 MAG: hypothetical protein US85_C0007G0013 [Candidatus Shapirobacteria bacterium GW2011_GWF1_38_23]
MNIVGVQLIVASFGFLMLYNLFLHWKKKDIGFKGVMVWFILWGGLIWITLFPKSIEPFIKELFFIRTFDFAAVAALIVLAYVMFENHLRINKLQQQIEKLVRIISLKKEK